MKATCSDKNMRRWFFPSSGQRNQGASMPKDAVVAKRVEAFEVILLLVR